MIHNWTGNDGVAVRYFDSSKMNATGLSLPCSLLASLSQHYTCKEYSRNVCRALIRIEKCLDTCPHKMKTVLTISRCSITFWLVRLTSKVLDKCLLFHVRLLLCVFSIIVNDLCDQYTQVIYCRYSLSELIKYC